MTRMTAATTILREADYRRMPWQNGLGWTTELMRAPDGGEFAWRISLAEVDADCDFSDFPGIDRSILVLTGAGMALHVGDDPAVTLAPEGPPLAFSGDLPARARLLAGPTRDFNVMTRRGRYIHTLARHASEGALALVGEVFIYVVAGALEVEGQALAAGDSLHRADVPGDSLKLTGTAELLLVRLLLVPHLAR